jgi:hypothetical protein
MSILDTISSSTSAALDSIINTKVFYRDNEVTPIQAGIILLLPQITAFLLQYNKEFGIEFKVQLENYPLLLFVFLVVMMYVLIEPSITKKSGDEISKIAFLSIHLFAFALSLNLIYAVLVPLFSDHDLLAEQISNLATYWEGLLEQRTFAMIYGLPFLAAAIGLIMLNSKRQYSPEQWKGTLTSRLFWTSFVVSVLLALYQYAAFILFREAAT